MIAIRVIIEVIIFIYMMGLSIGLRKQKIIPFLVIDDLWKLPI